MVRVETHIGHRVDRSCRRTVLVLTVGIDCWGRRVSRGTCGVMTRTNRDVQVLGGSLWEVQRRRRLVSPFGGVVNGHGRCNEQRVLPRIGFLFSFCRWRCVWLSRGRFVACCLFCEDFQEFPLCREMRSRCDGLALPVHQPAGFPPRCWGLPAQMDLSSLWPWWPRLVLTIGACLVHDGLRPRSSGMSVGVMSFTGAGHGWWLLSGARCGRPSCGEGESQQP